MTPAIQDPDSSLVERARSGDFRAFEDLVGLHERRLYRLSMNILRQREDAENVVQTTFLKVVENIAKFRGDSKFSTWATRIATHTALNVLRKRRGLPTVSMHQASSADEEGEVSHPEILADWRGDPVQVVERQELKRVLDDAIDSLDEKHRVVFVLRDVEGLSVAETAEVLGISEANVKVRLLRARLALREKLTGVFGDPDRVVKSSHDHGSDGAEKGAGPNERSTSAKALLEGYGQASAKSEVRP